LFRGACAESRERHEGGQAVRDPHRQRRPSVATSSRRSSIRTDRLRGMGEQPTLYEWAGGREAFDRMINAFYDRVENDELLSPLFPGGVQADHPRNVAAGGSEVVGGRSVYTDGLGGGERTLNQELMPGI